MMKNGNYTGGITLIGLGLLGASGSTSTSATKAAGEVGEAGNRFGKIGGKASQYTNDLKTKIDDAATKASDRMNQFVGTVGKYGDNLGLGGNSMDFAMAGSSGAFNNVARSADDVRVAMSKVDDVGGAPPKIEQFPIVEDTLSHLSKFDGYKKSGGISGTHNAGEFNKAYQELFPTINLDDAIVKQTAHPNIPGITEVEYRVPKKNADGSLYDPLEWTKDVYRKTIYDPAIWSDETMDQLGREAMGNILKIDGRKIVGEADNGLLFEAYINEDGIVTNFYPAVGSRESYGV